MSENPYQPPRTRADETPAPAPPARVTTIGLVASGVIGFLLGLFCATVLGLQAFVGTIGGWTLLLVFGLVGATVAVAHLLASRRSSR